MDLAPLIQAYDKTEGPIVAVGEKHRIKCLMKVEMGGTAPQLCQSLEHAKI